MTTRSRWLANICLSDCTRSCCADGTMIRECSFVQLNLNKSPKWFYHHMNWSAAWCFRLPRAAVLSLPMLFPFAGDFTVNCWYQLVVIYVTASVCSASRERIMFPYWESYVKRKPFVPSVVLNDFDRSFSLREAATQTARLLTNKQA